MLDVHAHLLPGIDDGPADLAAAVALVGVLRRQGVTQVVTTPHWLSPRFPAVLPAGIAAAYASLRSALPDGPEVLLGAEVHLAGVGGAEAFAAAVRLLGDGPCVLVELPDEHLPSIAWDALFTLRRRGLRPVLAHPERCRGLDPAGEPLAAFLASGGLLQLTLGHLLGTHGWSLRWRSRGLLKRHRRSCVIASDAHAASGPRAPLWDRLPAVWRELVPRDLVHLAAW